jgi:branched-chain amino acid transport system substrate-binding protein
MTTPALHRPPARGRAWWSALATTRVNAARLIVVTLISVCAFGLPGGSPGFAAPVPVPPPGSPIPAPGLSNPSGGPDQSNRAGQTAGTSTNPPANLPPGLTPLEAARAAAEAGDDRQVIAVIQQWLQTSRPAGEEAAEALYLIGNASWHLQQGDDAIFYLKKLLNDAPLSPLAANASVLLGQIYAGQGSAAEAITYLEKAVALNPAPDVRKPIEEQLIGLYTQTGNLLKAVDTLQALRQMAETAGDAAAVASLDGQTTGLIDHETDTERLQRLLAAEGKRFPADEVLLRLADLAAQQHEPYDEEQWLKRFLTDFPKHPKSAEISARVRATIDAVKEKTAVIGLLLPLSGPARAFGRSALRGAQVAWEAVPEKDREPIGLAIRDSQSPDALPAEKLERWAKEFHLLAVVGPLLGREMSQAAQIAGRLEVPFLNPGALIGSRSAPSEPDKTSASLPKEAAPNDGAPQEATPKDAAITPDSYLFWNGLTLAQQARSVADYAVTRLGAKRFMVLYPDVPYARTAAEVFSDTVRTQQGEVIASISYASDGTDYGAQIRAMKSADMSRYGTIGPPVEGKPPDEWPYTPGFDAIFLPGDAEQGGLVAAQLAFYGYEQPVLLGVGSWDRPELLTYGGRYVENAVMADGFFAHSDAPVVQEFVRRYQMRYHEEPDLFAAQAYDAVRMVISALQQGARSGRQVRDYLAGIRLYPGVSGQTTLVPGGPAQKQSVIIKVQNGKLVQVN